MNGLREAVGSAVVRATHGESDTFVQHLGIEFGDPVDGCVSASLLVEQRHLNTLGGVHGGCVAALVDSAAGWLTRAIWPGSAFATIDLHVTYLATLSVGMRLVATASAVHQGRRTAVISVVVSESRSDGLSGRQFATATVNQLNVNAAGTSDAVRGENQSGGLPTKVSP